MLLSLAASAALVPTPVGAGPRFRPAPAVHGPCAPGPLRTARRVHLELFARGRVVIVPAGIGLRGARFRSGRAVAARCRAALWTGDPSGVVHLTGHASLGDVFRVWGEPLGPARMLTFRGRVRVFRDGLAVARDPRRLPLRGGEEIVLEVGALVPPHRTYRFPR